MPPATTGAKTMTKRTAVYTRVSTTEQTDRLQRREIRAWLGAQGIEEPRWYADKASGTNTDRPAWQKILQGIAKGKIGTVVVWRLDRLSRSLKDFANIADSFTKAGVRLVSITENVDLDSITGRAMAGMLAVFAQFETSLRSERQRAGIDAAQAAGKTWGGSTKGWTKVKPAKVKAILDMHGQGMSKAAIARSVELSVPTVRKMIKAAVINAVVINE